VNDLDDVDDIPPPVDVAVVRDEGVTVTWDDGRVSSFELEELRVNCPCAACRALRDRGDPAWTPRADRPPLRIADAQLVGNWGLGVTWNDGHSTGIYPWTVLRVWAGPDAPDVR
jgi:DUF971 family protein